MQSRSDSDMLFKSQYTMSVVKNICKNVVYLASITSCKNVTIYRLQALAFAYYFSVNSF